VPEPCAAPLRIVVGPTAAGKSALALALAERTGAAIVSADSRQVYRGFDVGTAKPTAAERARVPHYGLDVADPAERWSAARFAEAAETWLADAAAAGRPPLVVGGTGFWLRALVAPLFEEPPLDPERRRALEHALAPLPTAELARWVRALDPPRAHLGRTQLLRAVEVALLTGRPISAWHAAAPTRPPRPARYLLVDPGRAALAERIATRTAAMLEAGWGEEVRVLQAMVPPDAPAWNATGYDEVRRWVAGDASRSETETAIVIATRQYAKRQRTWFRHQLAGADVTPLDPAAPDALARAVAWWEGA
jgi:tRNA dimethylallyltransferase